MSRYLGVEACNQGLYYFVSYNSEDEKRVSEFAMEMKHYDFPLWYYANQFDDVGYCVEKIMHTVGFSTDKKDLVNRLKAKYNDLSDEEKMEVTENYWNVSLQNNTLLTKATFFAEIQVRGLAGMDRKKDYEPYINAFNVGNDFITIHNVKISSKIVTCFHAGPYDADKIEIWKDDERIYTIGGLLDVHYGKVKMYYDDINDHLYISYVSILRDSASDAMKNSEVQAKDCVGVSIIYNPIGDAVGNDFKELITL